MNRFDIPNEYADLQDYVRGQDVRFWRKWSLSVAAIALIEILFLFEQVAGYVGWIWSAVICAAMVVVAFLACGGLCLLTDRPFEGVVEKAEYEVRNEVTGDRRQVHSSVRIRHIHHGGVRVTHHTVNVHTRQVNRCRMEVRTDEGRLIKYSTTMVGDPSVVLIKEGCRVRKYRRLPCPVVLDGEEPICAVCGLINTGDVDGTCACCGHILMRESDRP